MQEAEETPRKKKIIEQTRFLFVKIGIILFSSMYAQ